jgi:hypothetical protein
LAVNKEEEIPGKEQDNAHNDPEIRRVIQEKIVRILYLFV